MANDPALFFFTILTLTILIIINIRFTLDVFIIREKYVFLDILHRRRALFLPPSATTSDVIFIGFQNKYS